MVFELFEFRKDGHGLGRHQSLPDFSVMNSRHSAGSVFVLKAQLDIHRQVFGHIFKLGLQDLQVNRRRQLELGHGPEEHVT